MYLNFEISEGFVPIFESLYIDSENYSSMLPVDCRLRRSSHINPMFPCDYCILLIFIFPKSNINDYTQKIFNTLNIL